MKTTRDQLFIVRFTTFCKDSRHRVIQESVQASTLAHALQVAMLQAAERGVRLVFIAEAGYH